MALPDKNADEPVAEIESELWKLYREYLANSMEWRKLADDLLKKIKEQVGDAYAVVVDGEKVATYRPTAKYAEVALMRDFPDLTRHFVRSESRDVFDIQRFVRLHPEIAEKYKVRSFREVQP